MLTSITLNYVQWMCILLFVVYAPPPTSPIVCILSTLNKDCAVCLFLFFSPGHGYCSCGRCICQEGWFGKVCQFPRSCDMSDAQSREHCETGDGVVCNGKGEQIALDCVLRAIFLSKGCYNRVLHVQKQCHKLLLCFNFFISRRLVEDVKKNHTWLHRW